MNISAADIPDAVLDALFENPPGEGGTDARQAWRYGLAAAITAWENLQGDDDAHPHVHQQVARGLQRREETDQTIVLQRCTGCGEMSTSVLDGNWNWGQVVAGLVSASQPR
jgi:hypothetical protein